MKPLTLEEIEELEELESKVNSTWIMHNYWEKDSGPDSGDVNIYTTDKNSEEFIYRIRLHFKEFLRLSRLAIEAREIIECEFITECDDVRYANHLKAEKWLAKFEGAGK